MHYVHLPYFHVSNRALFFAWYSGTLILHRRSLDTFYSHDWFRFHIRDNCFARKFNLIELPTRITYYIGSSPFASFQSYKYFHRNISCSVSQPNPRLRDQRDGRIQTLLVFWRDLYIQVFCLHYYRFYGHPMNHWWSCYQKNKHYHIILKWRGKGVIQWLINRILSAMFWCTYGCRKNFFLVELLYEIPVVRFFCTISTSFWNFCKNCQHYINDNPFRTKIL